MDVLQETTRHKNRFENVIIGEKASRLSSAIFFMLCVIPIFSTMLFGAVDNVTWVFISIFWAVIILLWLVEAWRAKGLIFDPSVLQLPVLGLVLIGLVQLLPLGSGISGGLLNVPATRSLSLDPYTTRFFITHLVVYLTFFAACLTFINNERRLKKAVLLVIIFGAVMAFLGILQRLADPDMMYGIRSPGGPIPFGPFINQHHFAAFMEMTGGVALALLFGKKTGKDNKLLLAIPVIIMGVAIVLTSSRGGMLSFVSVLAFVLIMNFISRTRADKGRDRTAGSQGLRRKIAVAAIGAALILVIFGVVLFLGGNESLFRGIGMGGVDTSDLSNGRLHFWGVAIQIFIEHPILGAGLEAFGVAFTSHDTWNGALRVEQAHNEYLQTLADSGLAGFACVASFIFFLFKKGLGTITNTRNSFRRNAAIGALAGCFGIMIHSFVDFPLRTPSNGFIFLLLAAIATVSIKTEGDGGSHRRRRSVSEP